MIAGKKSLQEVLAFPADRARRIVRAVTNPSPADSERLLNDRDGEVKTAIVCHYRGISAPEARELLATAHGHLRAALPDRTASDVSHR